MITLLQLLCGLQLILAIIVTPAKSESKVVAEFRKEEFLHLHNYLRRSVVPTAANMIRLEWDDDIADVAKMHAETCSIDHIGYPGLYENLYSGGTNNITTIMMYYFMERELFDFYNSSKCDFDVCGHYMVITDSFMKYVGCAITKTRCELTNAYHSFCLYRKIPLINWTPYHYSPGKPCTSCPNSHSYCDNGLCVESSEEGKCHKVCHNCGYLLPSTCTCFCLANYLEAPDCSVLGYEAEQCYQCYEDPSSPPFCQNDGHLSQTTCSRCYCSQAYTGDLCQYNLLEKGRGVMLTFHWSEIRRGSLSAYFPMNIEQGPQILDVIRETIMDATVVQCGEYIAPIDISIAAGFPEIDIHGRLKMVLLVRASPCSKLTKSKNGDFMPQEDLLIILNSVKEQMSTLTIASHGTPLQEITAWK